jgi:hypothetical protein
MAISMSEQRSQIEKLTIKISLLLVDVSRVKKRSRPVHPQQHQSKKYPVRIAKILNPEEDGDGRRLNAPTVINTQKDHSEHSGGGLPQWLWG